MPILKPEADISSEDLFELATDSPWSVAYLLSRREKSFARYLAQRGQEFYLPMEEKRVRRRGRSQVSFLPLFPSYVFLRGGPETRITALRSNLVVEILQVTDQASLNRELRALWRLQRSGGRLVPHPYLGPGDLVELIDGPFRGTRGRVLREGSRSRLVVSISFLRQSVAAEFEREVLAPVRSAAARPIRARAS